MGQLHGFGQIRRLQRMHFHTDGTKSRESLHSRRKISPFDSQDIGYFIQEKLRTGHSLLTQDMAFFQQQSFLVMLLFGREPFQDH